MEAVIAATPAGLDTVIGERGVKLSGGQKQRLAIARMFVKNPPILILDEATSALDTETERAIQESLVELGQGPNHARHRPPPATIQNADRIVVVDETGIVEKGRDQEGSRSTGCINASTRPSSPPTPRDEVASEFLFAVESIATLSS